MRARLLAALLAPLLVVALAFGLARADETSDRSWLVGWVENTISTPDRQIRLGRIDGALSSDVRLESITLADRRGVWLTIRDVHLVWTRSDLLKGRLTVASLDAAAIEVARKPDPAADETASDDASIDFALPDLPVAVEIGRISVPRVRLPTEIAGRETILTLDGRGRLDGGDLDVALTATRLEPQGGAFTLKTTYAEKTRRLALDLALAEPKGGFLSTLLALPGEPPIDFSIRGDAPIDAFAADIALSADAKPLLSGRAATRMDGADRLFAVDVDGSLEGLVGKGGALTGGGSEVHLSARRSPDGPIRLDRARLRTGVAAFDAAGSYLPKDDGAELSLDRLAVAWKDAALDLVRPTTVTLTKAGVAVAPTTLTLAAANRKDAGTIDLAGSAGRDLDLTVTARRLPAALAALIAPDLGAAGAIGLDARIAGPRKSPKVAWSVAADGLSTAVTRAARLPAAKVVAKGTYAEKATDLDATAILGRDATLTAKGHVPLAGDGLALDVAATRLPVALADGVSPGLGARGTLSATAKLTGSLAAPIADWKLRGEALSAAATRDVGLGPLGLVANGRLDPSAVTLSATLTERDRLKLVANGRVPLDGGDLAMKLSGSASLALADVALRERGARATGRLAVDLAVAGPLAAPRATGVASLSDATLTDPETGMRLTGIGARIRLSGDRIAIEDVHATTGKSGRIEMRGALSLAPDLPGDLTIALKRASLAFGDILRSEIDGTLRLSGPLAREPALAGRIDLGRTEITIPERFAANAARLGVKDLKAPKEVARTLALAKPKARKGRGGGASASWRARLDVVVDSPGRLFVRGRGVDAELGGRLRVTGTTDAPIPVGSFELRRGGLDVIGRHIALDKGTVTLVGDLDPAIDFTASSSTRSVSVTVAVTGRASDPALALSSTPELPQDEVLSQFLFGRGVADLTGVQLVQLATAAAQLAGGPSAPDLLGAIRRSTGLDNLGTTTDSKGGAGLTAGRYIGERIYLGVTAGANGSTDATVDLDVTRNLKLRGQTGTDGSKAGFVFEKEY
ncbi:MAG: translocation/assembly module TamB domain-containing protein [Hyphomicrobiales bacterium]|nr:translocation/assembly module TamB domain-containing protein [Hyphomicrobiales bacterium]